MLGPIAHCFLIKGVKELAQSMTKWSSGIWTQAGISLMPCSFTTPLSVYMGVGKEPPLSDFTLCYFNDILLECKSWPIGVLKGKTRVNLLGPRSYHCLRSLLVHREPILHSFLNPFPGCLPEFPIWCIDWNLAYKSSYESL